MSQRIKELTIRIHISDHDKAWELLRLGMLEPAECEEKYGFSVNASAHGDLFSERDVFERALEKLSADDLLKEDMKLREEKPLVTNDDGYYEDAYFEDSKDLIDEAFRQADFYKDLRNEQYGTQKELPIQLPTTSKGEINV